MTICPHCGWPRWRQDGHACGDVRIGRDRLRTLVEAEEALTALSSTGPRPNDPQPTPDAAGFRAKEQHRDG